MMVYQAVAEYATRVIAEEAKNYYLSVTVMFPERKLANRFEFNRQNYHITRISKVRTSRCYSAL